MINKPTACSNKYVSHKTTVYFIFNPSTQSQGDLRMLNNCSFHKIGQPEYEFDLLPHQDPGTSAF
jgi:hypothetical protein